MGDFALFAGENYYACGGWQDFKGRFPSKEAAVVAGLRLRDVDWWHVADLATNAIVAGTKNQGYGGRELPNALSVR
jgi:hypothetical protein